MTMTLANKNLWVQEALLFIVLLTLINVASASMMAPEEEWNKTYGGDRTDLAKSVFQTADGGYVFGGCMSSYLTTYEIGTSDFWLIKTDSMGNELWNKSYDGSGSEELKTAVLTSDGGYILTGTTSVGILLIKTDADGSQEWSKIFGGQSHEHPCSVLQTSDGGYIILGAKMIYGTRTRWYDSLLIKTDSKGNEEWSKAYDTGKYAQPASIHETDNNEYVIAGTLSGDDKGNFWLMKVDSSGNKQWDKTLEITGHYDRVYSMQQTSDDGYILVGSTSIHSASVTDLLLVKTDSGGNGQWNLTIGGSKNDDGRSVQQTSDAGYIIAGRTESHGSGEDDAWIIRIDLSGNEKWNKTFGGAGHDCTSCIQQTSDGGYIISGSTNSYYAGHLESWQELSDAPHDAWLIKLEREPIEVEEETPTLEIPAKEEKGIPGFESISAVAGLLAVVYLLRRRG
jgi:PGF-CTERM protein